MIAQRLLVIVAAASLVFFSPQAHSAAVEPVTEKPAFNSLSELEWYVDELTEHGWLSTSVKAIEIDGLPAVCFDYAANQGSNALALAAPKQPYDAKRLQWRMRTLIDDIDTAPGSDPKWDVGFVNNRLAAAFVDHYKGQSTLKYAFAVQDRPQWPEDWIVSVVDRIDMYGWKVDLSRADDDGPCIVFEAGTELPSFGIEIRYASPLTKTPRTAEHWSVSPIAAKEVVIDTCPTYVPYGGYWPVILSKAADATKIAMYWSNGEPPKRRYWSKRELETGHEIGRSFDATALSDSYAVAFTQKGSHLLVYGLIHDSGEGMVVETHEIALDLSTRYDDPETAAMNGPFPEAIAIATISDRPFICVACSGWPSELRVLWAKKSRPTSSSDWEQAAIDSDVSRGSIPSVAVIDGLPYIAYLAGSPETIVRIALPVVKDK
jgi:hypothetical protein